VEEDSFKTIDLGLVEFQNKAGEKQIRYFINITDVGMGGVVAERLSRYSKWMGAYLTYQRAILTTLLSYKHQPVKAVADSFTYEGSIMNFIVANGQYFGSGLGIAPDASATDGEFSVVILGEISLLDYIKNLGSVQKCQKISHPDLHYQSAKEVVIDSPAGPLAIDMDGEFIGYSPMKVTVAPASVKFLC
jgi:diacylglycerol kinase family enzyme